MGEELKPVEELTVDEVKAELKGYIEAADGTDAEKADAAAAVDASDDEAALRGALAEAREDEDDEDEDEGGPHVAESPDAKKTVAKQAAARKKAGATVAVKAGQRDSADMIRALLEERAGYERLGKADRVKEVNAQLKAYGHSDGPKGRRRSPQSST